MPATLETLEPMAADEVYVLRIEPHHHRPVGRFVRGTLDLWCACFGGLMDLSRDADVVVRRRHDEGEELRLHAGGRDRVAVLLEQLDEDLIATSPAEFRAIWSIGAVEDV